MNSIVAENSEIPYKIIKEMKWQNKESQKNVKRKPLKEVLRNANQSNSSGSKSDIDGEINDGNFRNFAVVLLFLYLIICLFISICALIFKAHTETAMSSSAFEISYTSYFLNILNSFQWNNNFH